MASFTLPGPVGLTEVEPVPGEHMLELEVGRHGGSTGYFSGFDRVLLEKVA